MVIFTFVAGILIHLLNKFKTTAEMWFCNAMCQSKTRLTGKTVVITGANSGIGKETARDLYRRGARVILACRDLNKANEAVEDLKQNPPSNPEREQFKGDPGELAVYKLDLSSFQSVRECAKKLLESEPKIHILINNAGVMMCPYQQTEDGNELQFQSNHLGHFLLTLLLLPKIKTSSPDCRIINVSSMAHLRGQIHFDDINLEKSYGPLKAYEQSKLANVLMAAELARKLKASNISGINTYSLHPGVIKTEIGRHLDNTIFRGARTLFGLLGRPFMKNIEQGAQTTIHCAVDEKAGEETGLYYKECRPSEPSRLAKSEETAKKLWDESLRLVSRDQENLMEFFK